MSLRFPPSVRLHTRREFTVVDDRGRRITTRYFTILGAPNSLTHDRLGIIASRRLGGAVVRNRAKRRLREAFRRQRPLEASTSGRCTLDLVVIARRELLQAPFDRLEAELISAIKRLGVTRAA